MEILPLNIDSYLERISGYLLSTLHIGIQVVLVVRIRCGSRIPVLIHGENSDLDVSFRSQRQGDECWNKILQTERGIKGTGVRT